MFTGSLITPCAPPGEWAFAFPSVVAKRPLPVSPARGCHGLRVSSVLFEARERAGCWVQRYLIAVRFYNCATEAGMRIREHPGVCNISKSCDTVRERGKEKRCVCKHAKRRVVNSQGPLVPGLLGCVAAFPRSPPAGHSLSPLLAVPKGGERFRNSPASPKLGPMPRRC
ncbi:hypothetical protein Bbelb_106400 [Branchiostoma belcheri]|nr:hypothetical protein Bbelb_106400 [Branchiostoma belcheri]